ncbi:hypothetical protein [Campylobacter aviculae]|uniref:hypothetical protein n=1 Tax=Campylobacter aviculae TaxID=2510190 RepID=UPI0010F4EDBE|nr:hypothetical protein [Campylobacter aviculae]
MGTKSLAAMGLSMPFIFILFTLSDLIAIGSSVQIAWFNSLVATYLLAANKVKESLFFPLCKVFSYL